MPRQTGFTLIELVMVIVILGVLSAFALPRFADLGKEARTSSIQAAYGAVKSASSIAHAKFVLTSSNPLTLEGVSINMTFGHPSATAANGIGDAAQITNTDFDISATPNTITIQAKGASTPATPPSSTSSFLQGHCN